jgi:hypothetical protein
MAHAALPSPGPEKVGLSYDPEKFLDSDAERWHQRARDDVDRSDVLLL